MVKEIFELIRKAYKSININALTSQQKNEEYHQ
jgi:hypothetical protein